MVFITFFFLKKKIFFINARKIFPFRNLFSLFLSLAVWNVKRPPAWEKFYNTSPMYSLFSTTLTSVLSFDTACHVYEAKKGQYFCEVSRRFFADFRNSL